MKVDVNKPLENPLLKELFKDLRKAKEDDEYVKIFNKLAEEIAMKAHFLSVIELTGEPEEKSDGSFVLKEDTEMSFPMLTNQENQAFYPIFIDWEELYKWEDLKKENLKTAIFNFDDYLAMIFSNNGSHGIVINPFSDNFVLDKETLKIWKSIKEAKINGKKYNIAEDTKVILGTPSEYPTEMVNNLIEYSKKDSRVNAIWLRLMMKEEEKIYLLVVDINGDKDEVFTKIAGVVTDFLPKGYFADMVELNSDFGKRATENQEPFYKKS